MHGTRVTCENQYILKQVNICFSNGSQEYNSWSLQDFCVITISSNEKLCYRM